MKHLLLAVAFLSRIPIPQGWLPKEPTLNRAVPFFPLVGVLIGGLAFLGTALALEVLSPLTAAVFGTVLLTLLSGGLHLDGLADTADGFLSGKDREGMLAIMKDPTCGAMGVIALISLLLLKAAFLTELCSRGLMLLLPGIVLGATAGRVSQVLGMCLLPYAREGGLGALTWNRGPRNAVLGLIVLISLSIGFALASPAFDSATAVLVLVTALAANLIWARVCSDKLEGGTGDTVGAISEISEVMVMGAVVIGSAS
ncbi:MAG: adenosylcobinamide-GDP ribazoletransferase [Planctomycetota bacterium]|jgi:adenosylcobinamide-GDP ribazoletransferase